MSKVHPKKIINKSELDDLCKTLLSIDTDIQKGFDERFRHI
jgi:hypothetical protein